MPQKIKFKVVNLKPGSYKIVNLSIRGSAKNAELKVSNAIVKTKNKQQYLYADIISLHSFGEGTEVTFFEAKSISY